MLTAFGVVAVSFMLVTYALEARNRVFVLLFALGCTLSAVYGLLSGAWPFAVAEAVWAVVAVRRYRARAAAEA